MVAAGALFVGVLIAIALGYRRLVDWAKRSVTSWNVNKLIKQLRDPEFETRGAAADTLGDLGDARAVSPLIDALDDCPYVSSRAATALSKLGDSAAVQPLRNKMKTGELNFEVFRALTTFDRAEAVNIAESMLLDDNWSARSAGAAYLKDIEWEPENSEIGASFYIETGHLEKCLGIGPSAINPLIRKLRTKPPGHPTSIENLEQVLISMSESMYEPILDLSLNELDRDAQYIAIDVFAEIGDSRAIEPIRNLVKAGCEWGVRNNAASAIEKILGRNAVSETTVADLQSGDAKVRRFAVNSLGSVKPGDAAVKLLVTTIGDTCVDVAADAVGVLGKVGDTEAVPALIETLHSTRRTTTGHTVRGLAAVALGRIGDVRAVVPLVELLSSSEWPERHAAAQALGQLRDGRAEEELKTLLHDPVPEVREEAQHALASIALSRSR